MNQTINNFEGSGKPGIIIGDEVFSPEQAKKEIEGMEDRIKFDSNNKDFVADMVVDLLCQYCKHDVEKCENNGDGCKKAEELFILIADK